MDKRINYKIVLDTETCPLDKDFQGVDPNNMWVYDMGWVVTDKQGRIYEKRSFVNADIFLKEKELMKSSYYSDKIPKYWDDIHKGTRTLTTFYNIRKIFMEDVEKYGVNEFYAFNMRFDYNTLNNTQRWLSKSKYRYFLPYGCEVCDIMMMARDTICCRDTYKRFCQENGYMTKNNRPQTKAETVYRYIKRDTDFEEEHTGLADVLIETEILAYCYKQKKAMKRRLWEN